MTMLSPKVAVEADNFNYACYFACDIMCTSEMMFICEMFTCETLTFVKHQIKLQSL